MSAARRTALLIDVSDFSAGQTILDSDGEPLPPRFVPLRYDHDADQLADVLKRGFHFEVERSRNPSTAELGRLVTDTIRAHQDGDVVVVHVLSHGVRNPRFDGIIAVGSDGRLDQAADVAGWLRVCAESVAEKDTNGPHVLFLLDFCNAGEAVELDTKMRRTDASRTWILAATTAETSAFDARFTRAANQVLRRLSGEQSPLDLNPGDRFVPLATFAQEVRKTVYELAEVEGEAARQTVTGTQIDLAAPDSATAPFFHNPRFRSAARPVSVPAFRDVRQANYFLIAAAGEGLFTGRAAELSRLLSWLTDPANRGTLVVTGRAGVGKSALLGVVVCTVHPELSKADPEMWRPAAATLPRGQMGAVNVRQLDLSGIVFTLSDQLDGTHDARTPTALIDAIRRRGHCPAVVVDALEEALDPTAVLTELLLPLASARDDAGRPICRLLVGARDEEWVKPLSQVGDTMDLNQADVTKLRVDLDEYATRLLRKLMPEWSSQHVGARAYLATAIAERLTGDVRSIWGEYLITRLYLQRIANRDPITDDHTAAKVGREVPLDPADLLDTDLGGQPSWVRPVLTAIAWAHGYGMPLEVIPAVAAVYAGGFPPPEAEVIEVLEANKYYLRKMPGREGFVLYQLFHQGLADRLRDGGRSGEVFKALLRTVPGRWDLAPPYVQRHILDHAKQAGLANELLANAGFLLAGPPEDRMAALTELGEQATAAIAVLRAYQQDSSTPSTRLAVEAIRHGGMRLAASLSPMLRPVWYAGEPAAPPPRPWQDQELPMLAVGDGSNTVTLYSLSQGPGAVHVRTFAHTSSVLAMTTVRHNGQDELLCGGYTNTVEVWPITGGAMPRLVLRGHKEPVRCITTAESFGRTVAVTGSDDCTVRVWDLDTGEVMHTFTAFSEPISQVHVLSPAGRPPIIATRTAAGFQILQEKNGTWGIRNIPASRGGEVAFAAHGRDATAVQWLTGRVVLTSLLTGASSMIMNPDANPVTAAITVADKVVTTDGFGDLRAWEKPWRNGPTTVLAKASGAVQTLIPLTINGKPAVLTSTAAGRISIRDIETGSLIKGLKVATQAQMVAVTTVAPRDGERLPSGAVTSIDVGLGFDGVVLATGHVGGTVRTRHAEDEFLIRAFDGPVERVHVHSRDGWAVVASLGRDGQSVRNHPLTGHRIDLPLEIGPPRPVDQDWLVTDEETIQVRAHSSGVVLWQNSALTGHSGAVHCVCAWRHGDRLLAASGGSDSTLRVWNISGGTHITTFTLPAAAQAVRAVADQILVHCGGEAIAFVLGKDSL